MNNLVLISYALQMALVDVFDMQDVKKMPLGYDVRRHIENVKQELDSYEINPFEPKYGAIQQIQFLKIVFDMFADYPECYELCSFCKQIRNYIASVYGI